MVPALRKRLGHQHTAAATCLRGVPRIDAHNRPPSPFCLDGEMRKEYAPPSIVNALCEHGTSEANHVEVFEGNQPEAIHDLPRRLVNEVPPLIANMYMRSEERRVGKECRSR